MVKGEHIDFPLPETVNLGSYFLDVNLELGRGDKTAIYYKDRTYSFRELWRLTNKVGNVLKDLGVEPEQRVLLILEDTPEWVAAWLATMKVGAVGTHAYTYLTSQDYEYLLNLVRPKVVVVDKTTLGRVREACARSRYRHALLVAGGNGNDLAAREFSLGAMVEAADGRLDVEPTHRDDPAFWNFSSGTTGKSKGVPHVHRDGVIGFESFNYLLGYTPEDIVLRVPKLFFHYARDVGCFFPLRSGAAIVLFEEKSTAALLFRLIAMYRPTVLINVPTMMRAMIQTPAVERGDLSCLRLSMSSGELLSAQLHEEWVNTFGSEVVNRFGSAESAIGYLCNRPGAVVPGSSGTVTPMTEIKLVDDRGLEVPTGEVGVLMVRSDASGLCYVRQHEKSRTTFPGDGWIYSGDLFRRDDRGYFWYIGRADEMVKVSGVWLSPLEIERAIHNYPGVSECAVVGVRDEDGLVKTKAFVVMESRVMAAPQTAQLLTRACKEQLGPHKFPGSIVFMDELPKTGQGKIDRRHLRERSV